MVSRLYKTTNDLLKKELGNAYFDIKIGSIEALKENKENLEIEFYLNRLATKRAKVTDEQVINIYEANKVQLKNISPEIALPQIKEQLLLQQVNLKR